MAADTKTAREPSDTVSKREYRARLHALQIELVKLQRHFISDAEKILVLIEGRDAAGKDGTIKRIVKHLSPRETRVVALGKPTEREESTWYFQRFAPYLPAAQEFVLFNRSWYNRAGVERVMGFCTEAEVEEFFETVLEFEAMLVRAGTRFFKYYIDISREEQAERLSDRLADPLKQWKISPIDACAQDMWDDYSRARNEMLLKTSTDALPWTIVRTDEKRTARLNLIGDLLSRIDYPGKEDDVLMTDKNVVFRFKEPQLKNGVVAP
jgi:polyphosphate kinase 2